MNFNYKQLKQKKENIFKIKTILKFNKKRQKSKELFDKKYQYLNQFSVKIIHKKIKYPSMKSTNIRQLMNILSDKYFGSQLTSPGSKQPRSNSKPVLNSQQNNYSILSPITNKPNAKLNRISSSHQKRNQNYNFVQDKFNNTANKKALSQFQKHQTNTRSQNKNFHSIDEQNSSGNQNGVLKKALSRKYSHKNLFQGSENNLQITLKTKNCDSRIMKEFPASILPSNSTKKKLFLKQNNYSQNITTKTLCTNTLQQNSTISNSRSSNLGPQQKQRQLQQNYHTHKNYKPDNCFQLHTVHSPQKSLHSKDKSFQQLQQKVQFYLQKCLNLQRQNTQLKQKIFTYEEQFKQEKIMVDNLKNMMLKREKQIDQLIQDKIGRFNERQGEYVRIEDQNKILKEELNEVRNVLRQQEALIIELYSKKKGSNVNEKGRTNSVLDNESTISRKIGEGSSCLPLTLSNSPQNISYIHNQSEGPNPNRFLNQNFGNFSYLDRLQQRESIQQTCYEEDCFEQGM